MVNVPRANPAVVRRSRSITLPLNNTLPGQVSRMADSGSCPSCLARFTASPRSRARVSVLGTAVRRTCSADMGATA